MYTVTFYSFKGGVGRTMALANVAYSLVEMGRNVVVLDFDLEAPGLDTMLTKLRDERLGSQRGGASGILEFVSDYLAGQKAPVVTDYVHPVFRHASGGTLWIMPAGRADDSYADRLAAIDWGRLYAEEGGYYLFEHLRQQIAVAIGADYLLVDSRTGHTDIGGICTRQLADAVVVLFIPNEQHRRGLSAVVPAIRSEKESERRDISLHFVMSNVPDLDDEDEILARWRLRFRKELAIRERIHWVHRYDSLLLLEQAIFTYERPKSRLAEEYRDLATMVQMGNPEDEVGALRFIQQVRSKSGRVAPTDRERRLEKIQSLHSHNGEVLHRLAELRVAQRRFEEASRIIEQAIDAGNRTPDALMLLGEMIPARRNGRKIQATVQQAFDAIRPGDASSNIVNVVDRGVQLLRRTSFANWPSLAPSRAWEAMDADSLMYFVSGFTRSKSEMVLGVELLGRVLRARSATIPSGVVSVELSLRFIALGEFRRAVELLSPLVLTDNVSLPAAFNYAMAHWGATGAISPELFLRVLSHRSAAPTQDWDVNRYQAMAMAAVATNNEELANRYLEAALNEVGERTVYNFSAWRFLTVGPDLFLEDLYELELAIKGKMPLSPRVIRQENDVEPLPDTQRALTEPSITA